MELHQNAHGGVQMLLLLQPHDAHARTHLQSPGRFLDGTGQVVRPDIG